MKFIETDFPGLYIVEPKVFQDDRGFFYENYSQEKFKQAGFDFHFVQDNHSLSKVKGVLRGLHYQNPPYAQTKLVRVIHGRVLDIVVDIRKSSPTFKKYFMIELSASEFRELLIPVGFAHGYLVLEENTEFLYKVDNPYRPDSEGGILWNDPLLRIPWGIENPILSEKDKQLPGIKELSYF